LREKRRAALPSIISTGSLHSRRERVRAPQNNAPRRENTTHVDRSEVPIQSRRRYVESRLVAGPVAAGHPAPAFPAVESDERGLQLRSGVQEPRPGGRKERSRGAD